MRKSPGTTDSGCQPLVVLGGAALLAMLAVVYLATRDRAVDATAPKIRSLAVLPLKNLSVTPPRNTL